MHGHGDRPYHCTYAGCERSMSGNGFPRQWNLRDHMRRVHHDNGSSLPTNLSDISPRSGSGSAQSKSRRKKKDSSDRRASQKAAEPKVDPREKMHQEWREHRAALTALMAGIEQPDAACLQALQEIQSRASAMMGITNDLVQGSLGFTQQSG